MKIILKKNNTFQSITDFMLLFYFVIVAYSYFGKSNYYILRFRLILMVSAGILGFLTYFLINFKNKKMVLYIFLLVSSWILSIMLKRDGYYETNYFIYTISFMGIGAGLVSHRQNIMVYRFLFYGAYAYILYRVLIKGVDIRNFLQDGSSYNFISVFGLFFLGIYCIVQTQNGIQINVVQTLLFLILTIISYGRGGIVTGITFTGLFIIFKFLKGNEYKKLMFIISGFIVLVLFSERILLFISTSALFGKFRIYGYTSMDRIKMWTEYLQNSRVSMLDFLFGSNAELIAADGNLHNAFLQMYNSFGLIFTIITIGIIVSAEIYFIKEMNYNMLIISITLLLRSVTDRVFFRGVCEVLLFAIIVQYLSRDNTSNNFMLRNREIQLE